MKFSHRGDELVYCTPDEAGMRYLELVGHAAGIRVELLYPMSGLETEEPILQPGRIDVLLGQGQTAQVLRNLCLMVAVRMSAPFAGKAKLARLATRRPVPTSGAPASARNRASSAPTVAIGSCSH